MNNYRCPECGAGIELIGRQTHVEFSEFLDLVAKMRAEQVEYFKTRSSKCLMESKRHERRVDEKLAELKSGQRKLFD